MNAVERTGNMEWANVRLSLHFSLWELCRSESHPELVEPPPPVVEMHLRWWVRSALEPLRAVAGRLRVLSGYRNPRLNRAVGGVGDSIHRVIVGKEVVGVATDIEPLDMPVDEFFRLVATMRHLPVRAAIIYPTRFFVHLDSRRGTETSFFVSRSKGLYEPLPREAVANYRISKED